MVDSWATKHICGDRSVFCDYDKMAEGEEQVFMGDSRPTSVLGKGKELLKLTYGKILSLSNLLHVKDICYNLVSVSILGKVGVRVSFEGDKVILSKNGVLVGKGYCSNGLFMLNVLNVIMNESASSSAYIVDSLDLWYARLSHVNFVYIKKMK